MRFLGLVAIATLVPCGYALEKVCPTGTFTSHYRTKCFHIVPTPVTFEQAKETCTLFNARLAVLDNSEDNQIVADGALLAVQNMFLKDADFWIGGDKENDAKSWGWIGGSSHKFTYTNWAPGEPVVKNGFNCLLIDSETGKWKAGNCELLNSYVCESESSLAPTPTPCESSKTTTCPACPKCPTTTPPIPVTCPVCPTTTSKSTQAPTTTIVTTSTPILTSTATESPTTTTKRSTTTPSTTSKIITTTTSAPTTTTTTKTTTTTVTQPPLPYGWHRFAGHDYFFNPFPLNWHAAEHSCRRHGARLTSIHSYAEEFFIARLVQPSYNIPWIGVSVWIGASAQRNSRHYRWVDRTHWDFTNWQWGYPVRSYESTCASMTVIQQSDRKWRTYPCYMEAPFVCKKPTRANKHNDILEDDGASKSPN